MESRVLAAAAAASLTLVWAAPIRAAAARPASGADAAVERPTAAPRTPTAARSRTAERSPDCGVHVAPGPQAPCEGPRHPRSAAADRAQAPDARPRPAPRDAAEDGTLRTEANTAEPLPRDRGIVIPTVHIGILPRPDHPPRVGAPGSFEVPGESQADAARRKVLMRICTSC